jgi:hypothetical protein
VSLPKNASVPPPGLDPRSLGHPPEPHRDCSVGAGLIWPAPRPLLPVDQDVDLQIRFG